MELLALFAGDLFLFIGFATLKYGLPKKKKRDIGLPLDKLSKHLGLFFSALGFLFLLENILIAKHTFTENEALILVTSTTILAIIVCGIISFLDRKKK